MAQMIQDSFIDWSGDFWWRQYGGAANGGGGGGGNDWWEGYWRGEQAVVNHIVRVWLK